MACRRPAGDGLRRNLKIRTLFARLSLAAPSLLGVGLGALVLLCCWAAFYTVVAKGLVGETAAWLQAAGSTAAIGGAIWLSDIERRRNRHQRREEREEVAWSLRFAVSLARTEANIITQELCDEDQDLGKDDIRHWLLRCRNARQLIQHYTSNPNHLHPAFAQAGCNGLLLCDAMEADIEALAPVLRGGRRPTPSQISRVASYQANFELLVDQIDERMDAVSSALDRSGDILPIRMKGGWLDGAKRSEKGA